MTKQGIHYVPANTKRGRQIAAQTARIDEGQGLTPEQQQWNAEIEARRRAKQERKQQRRNDGQG